MPILTRWYLRSAIVCLVLGLALGVDAGLHHGDATAVLLGPFVLHLLVVGWATQMIFGVGYWMFPRVAPARSFGPPALGWTGFTGLNLGLLLRAIGEPYAALHGPLPAAGGLLVASALLQFAAVLAMAVLLWRRVAGR
jgi:hypothetical protein